MVEAVAQAEPGGEGARPPARAPAPADRGSWRAGLGCCLALLSVAGLVAVGQLAETIGHRHDLAAPGAVGGPAAPQLADRLNSLPLAEQSPPVDNAGVARLLTAAGLPLRLRISAAFGPGETRIALGLTGECVYVDIRNRGLFAWPAPRLAPCQAGSVAAPASEQVAESVGRPPVSPPPVSPPRSR
ncbi:hypothetical protein [Streptacidiphilus albus]|uniref:hypothetical protein n=1 Tax=Streptacidiphilus albus TaxID=105425 RepID=UPI00054B2D32|nr:hypothetical protein [Streptacidiphilus albus]